MGYTGPHWGFGPIAGYGYGYGFGQGYGYGHGYGYGYGALPPRAVYGPSVSPNEFPYYYGQYPSYTAVSPYPRSVSSYSSGPSAYPRVGPVGR